MKYLKPQSGMILTIALLLGVSFTIISLAVMQFSVQHYTTARRGLIQIDALDLAEAGADNFMYHINQDSSYAGTNTSCPIGTSGENPVTLFNNSVKGKGTYETCVQNGTITNEKIVYSTGKIYQPATASKPTSTRTVKLIIEGSSSPAFGIQTGPGGLIIGNNVALNTTGISVGGYITMSNNSTIGSVASPATVNVGNYQCPLDNPPGSSFPILCGSGEPISMSNGTHIYGTINANGQQNPGCCASKMTNPGLAQTSGVSNTTLPDPDRATMKTNATGSGSATAMAGFSTCKDLGSSGKTGVHITGNVSLPNNCTSTVYGDVWIDGNLSTGNNVTIKVASTLNSAPQVAIDGSTGLSLGNDGALGSNASGIGMRIVTYWNAGGDLDAATLTGNDLYDSMYSGNNRSTPICTINPGNNASVSSATSLYARWGCVNISNNGAIGQVLGQIIKLSNNGTVTFNGGTSGGAVSGWDVRYYEQI